MKSGKKIVMMIAGVLLATAAGAQDMHFSQFYETSILRNPALTGVFSGDYKVGALYKSQWSSISKPFQTGVATAELRFPVNKNINDFISFGLLASYDKAGTINFQTITVYPAVNYNKILEDEHNTYLSVGFTGGFNQRSIDVTRMTFNNQYQNNSFSYDNPSGEQGFDATVNHWDLGAGVSYSSNTGINNTINYFFGVSGYHFTRPNRSFYNIDSIRLGMKVNATAGVTMPVGANYSLQAYANYMRQGSYSEVIGGGLFGWHKTGYTDDEIAFAIYGGLFYRLGDAVIPTVKIRIKEYSIGFSYDTNISKLRVGSNFRGGYELTLFKTGLFKNIYSDRSKTICPRPI